MGRSVAQACADVGAIIYAVGRSESRLEAVINSLAAPIGSNQHNYIVGDLSSFEAAVNLFKEIQDVSQGVDGVFYSAGTEVIKPTRLLNAKDIENTMGAALQGALGAAKICASKNSGAKQAKKCREAVWYLCRPCQADLVKLEWPLTERHGRVFRGWCEI